MTALLGQSSAAQTISSLTSLGVHGTAKVLAPGTRPANSLSPSPVCREGPQAKQVGNGWMVESRNGDDRLASPAASTVIGGGTSRSTVVADASATRSAPSYNTTRLCSCSM